MSITTVINAEVYVRQRWGDAWRAEPYLEAVSAERSAGPSVGQAMLLWHYGRRSFEGGDGSFSNEAPMDYCGWFVQIRATIGGAVEELFTGIIIDDELAEPTNETQAGASEPVPTGTQPYTAAALSFLMTQRAMRTAQVEQGSGISTIDWIPAMNERHQWGPSLAGNRSANKIAAGYYVFSEDGALWTHRDYLEMVLSLYHVEGVEFFLAGQASLLDQIISSQSLGGLTVKEIVDRLIDRRRGFGWRIGPAGFAAGGPVEIEVFTVFAETLTIGEVTLTPNPFILELSFGDEQDRRIVSMRSTDMERVAKVRVLGERIVSCFSIDSGDYEKAWTDDQETAYLAGASAATGYDSMTTAEKETANDRYRADERFGRVFTTVRMPKDWDWQIGGDFINPTCDDDGTIQVGTPGDYWNTARKFLNKLPLERGKLNTDDDPDDYNPSDAEPEFRAPFALIKYDADGKYYYLHRLAEGIVDSEGNPAGRMGLRMLSRELGVEVVCSPNYLLAYGQMSGAEPSEREPVLDWQELILTVATETDQRLSVVAQAEGYPTDDPDEEQGREEVIEVPGAQCWIIAQGTAVGIDENGELLTYGGYTRELRTDKTRLQAIAAAALGWWSKRRQTLTIEYSYLMATARCGDYIAGVWDGTVYQDINTVVSSVNFDFRGQRTTIETGYGRLDFAAMGGRVETDLGTARAMAKELRRQGREISEIKREVDGGTVATGGGNGGGVGGIRRARINETPTSDGELEVVFVDDDGDDVGSGFDVYTAWDKSALDMADYLPALADDDLISIVQIDGTWYLNWNPIEVGEKTTTISSTAGTILGRIVYEFGIHS